MAAKMHTDPQHYAEYTQPAAFLENIVRRGEAKRDANRELARTLRELQGLPRDDQRLEAPAIEPDDIDALTAEHDFALREFEAAKKHTEYAEKDARDFLGSLGASPEEIKDTLFALDVIAMGQFERTQTAPETVAPNDYKYSNAVANEMGAWAPNSEYATEIGMDYVSAVFKQMVAGARHRAVTESLPDNR